MFDDQTIDEMVRVYNGCKTQRDGMRAAVSVLAKKLLDLTTYEYDSEFDAVIATWEWMRLHHTLPQHQVKQMIRDGICIWASNRLAALSAVEDPAFAAVKAINLAGRCSSIRIDDTHIVLSDTLIRDVIEAVRGADGKGGSNG